MKQGFVYIMASSRKGTLYIGVTSDLPKRIWEHKTNAVEGFTKKYGCHTLVWYQLCDDIPGAIAREKQMKKWNRAWKIQVIEEMNPEWKDLANEL